MAHLSLLTPPEATPSPTVERLRAGDATAARAFEHGPLIEPIPGDERHRAVTFAWRGDAGHVQLIARALVDRDQAPAQLERLPNSDLWLRTYRLRADLRSSYCFVPGDGEPPPPPRDVLAWDALLRAGRPDPLNPDRQPMPDGSQLSLLTLPDAPPERWWQPTDAPAGRVERHRLRSVAFANERDVWLYTPPGEPDGPLPLAVLLDGDIWARLHPIAPLLDNLIAAGRIPPLCAALVDPVDGEARLAEMGLHHALPAFLTYELLPLIARHAPVTDDPRRTLIGGHSLGGVAAALAGLVAPERFGLVLSQSGSFHWPETEDSGELVRRFAKEPRAPIRIWAEVGALEGITLVANRHFRDVLVARGYPLAYREYAGGHDYACWRTSIADGLIALLQEDSA